MAKKITVKGVRDNTALSTGSAPLPGITKESYLEMSQAFIKARERSGGTGLAILPGMLAERQAWQKYYNIKGYRERLSMNYWLDGPHPYAKAWTVATQWPWEFDQSVSEEMIRDHADPVFRQVKKFGVQERPETKASRIEWLIRAKVDHLAEDHPERRKAAAAWVSWACRHLRAPSVEMAADDPVRQGPPPGWTGLGDDPLD